MHLGTPLPMSDQPVEPTATTAAPQRRTLKTAIFVGVVGVVLATFVVLGQQGRPPNMPATPQHKLQINHNGDLTGFVGEPELDAAAAKALDKRAVEKRVNTTCQTCHGSPGDDPRVHACGQSRCLPANHPPKTECIKCHRMPPTTTIPTPTSTK